MNVLTINFKESQAASLFCQSMKNTGFAVIENHPVDHQLVQLIYEEWQHFFQNEALKHTMIFNAETQDGFFPKSISETAKGATEKDLKEYFQYYPWGKYPESFSQRTPMLYQQLSQLAATLLNWLDEGLPNDISAQLSMPLSKMIVESKQTMLRILHYPPLQGSEPAGAVRAAAHEDINLITLLVGATQSGLQVKDRQGNWFDVPGGHQSIIVNVGDMLELASGHYYRSTTHRVINPTDGNTNNARLSMPLFLHPNPEVTLSPHKTARQYLVERLTELGVYAPT